MTALRPEDALCRNWPDDRWVVSRDPELGEVCGWCPVRVACARIVLHFEDARDRPCGWYAGHYLPEVGGDRHDRELRRLSLAALRKLVSDPRGDSLSSCLG